MRGIVRERAQRGVHLEKDQVRQLFELGGRDVAILMNGKDNVEGYDGFVDIRIDPGFPLGYFLGVEFFLIFV